MTSVFETVRCERILPVVTLEREEDALPVAEALVAGGLHVVEVVLRTPAAITAIAKLAGRVPGLLLGAGTVLNADQASRAADAGATFLVAPGFSPAVADVARRHGLEYLPGVATSTEIMTVLDHGLTVMKLFPAETIGGIRYLQAISGPFHHVRFIPTGGIDERNLRSYLDVPTVIGCGGSWMVKPALITGRQFQEITRLTREAADRAKMIHAEVKRP